ncbi:MAG TPA: transcriptional repressor [Firmicutes bacterium]|nr:transcriptional repressor [Candidatus Fermentithermobacillaceae bacterium]
MDTIVKKLRDAGLKVTPQRLAIYKMLLSTKGHPTADEICRTVKESIPGLSFNTVYKTLLSLEEKGLVQRLDVGQDCDRFDANTRSHVHLVCLNCGKVSDFGDDTPACVADLTGRIKRESDWDIRTASFAAYGYCPECRGTGGTELTPGASRA